MKLCPACSREYGDEHARCPDDGVGLVLLDTSAKAREENLIGQVVDGRYRIERIVGRGGMGTIYACRHVVVGKACAMKVLKSSIERSEEILQRFVREAQAANSIASRHICQMSDFGQLPSGAFYVVMELLQGMSLTRALRERRLGRKEMIHVFAQVADALHCAHQRGVVHRDMKPDNVVLIEDGADPHFVKLVDFGIAKVLETQTGDITETGVILGTPYYMAPEQARGDPVDHRCDIYALGVMMYRAFTGRLPFVADTAMGVLTRHLTEEPELPSRISDVDPTIERIILRCMEKQPIGRFQSMDDVAQALRSVPERVPERASHPTVDERSATPLRAVALRGLEGLPDAGPGPGPEAWAPAGREQPPSDRAAAILAPMPIPFLPAPSFPAQAPLSTGFPASVPLALVPAGPTSTPTPGGGYAPVPTGGYSVVPSSGFVPPPTSGREPTPGPAPAALGPAWPAAHAMASQRAPVLAVEPVEAFTNRGVVSSRLPAARSGRRVALAVGAAIMLGVGAAAALALLAPSRLWRAPAQATGPREPATAGSAVAPATSVAPSAGPTGSASADAEDEEADEAEETEAGAAAWPATSTSAAASAAARPSGRPPPPRPVPVPPRPGPEIESPFH